MINKLHERSLRIKLNDYVSDFTEFLENNNAMCNHKRNELTLPIKESMLNWRINTYKLWSFQWLLIQKKHVWCCLEILRYQCREIWSLF